MVFIHICSVASRQESREEWDFIPQKPQEQERPGRERAVPMLYLITKRLPQRGKPHLFCHQESREEWDSIPQKPQKEEGTDHQHAVPALYLITKRFCNPGRMQAKPGPRAGPSAPVRARRTLDWAIPLTSAVDQVLLSFGIIISCPWVLVPE